VILDCVTGPTTVSVFSVFPAHCVLTETGKSSLTPPPTTKSLTSRTLHDTHVDEVGASFVRRRRPPARTMASAPPAWSERLSHGCGFPPPPPHKLEKLRPPGVRASTALRGFCYWGAHPYTGASGPVPADEARAALTPLLRLGVSLFVTLQDNLVRPAAGAAPARRSAHGEGAGRAK